MNIKTLAINALVAAAYVALSLIAAPIAFSNIQFRIPEMFNHLIVFNKKYFFGIILGVLLTNLFSPTGVYDLVFGVAHSALSLGIVIFFAYFIKHKLTLLVINTLVFTFNMFIIAFQLYLAADLPFLLTWLTTAVGEFGIMAIGIPVMYALNKKLNFNQLMERR
ncbi:Queuosine precursor transporter QueT [Lentibacillus sp. JNUCC-1]|uniref:QueT transporter family protein n=1 Tax=Lentibacillus sp. JNUCC-1 TaxID=2654513 RepID=UPI0012E886A3|nr:QueT transporter family protein [Lentibacillus sp. JNUCC-1]MUV38625.1 Queuosine precursor transporter QueT [Lentibacillus sp. JNUCC-1]